MNGGDGAAGSREDAIVKRGRSTLWIVLCGILAVAAVGLGVWALSAQSNADDTQAKLDAATKAAAANQADSSQAQATATPAPTAAPTAAPTPDAATQQQFDELTQALGATNETLDEMQSDLDKAATAADDAQLAKADASGALERAKADLASFRADLDVKTTCLRGVLEALKTAFASGGTEAVVQQLQTLSGACRSSGS
jgi:type VI protein secretion system component VasF